MAPRGPLLGVLVATVACALTWPGRVGAERETLDAAQVTQSGRSLDRALDQVLARPPGLEGERTVLLLVDVTRTLKEAGFRERLAQALTRRATELRGTAVGLARAGAKGTVTVPPGGDRVALLTDLDAAFAKAATNPVRNLYPDVREAASALAGREGAREVVLITLDNGDLEDDLEATVKALERAKARLSVVTREAWLADSYAWSHAATVQTPRGDVLMGGDGAWPEIPWGWLLQQQSGHEVAPSGLALFGLTRLAAASGGRVFLHAGEGGAHACAALGECAFCAADHLPPGEVYLPHRVKALAPSVRARDEVLAQDARDPWVRRVLELWAAAGKEGLIRSRPTASLAGGSLKLEPTRGSALAQELSQSSLGFARLAKEAAGLRAAAERMLAAYDADLAKLDPAEGSPRHRASAETAGVMLHLTALNLELFEAFCREAGPSIVGKDDAPPQPPEQERVGEDQRVVGWSYITHCLCHGVLPFRTARLGWTPQVRDARLAALEQRLAGFFARYDNTPYGIAVRRSGLSVFVPLVQGKVLPLPPRRGGSTDGGGEPPTTTSDRPGRGGGAGSGDGAPTTTGK